MTSTLAKRIRTILEEQDLRQTELAEALGVSVNYISLLANGKKTTVSLTLAKLIESLYGYSALWVINGPTPDQKNEEELRRAVLERIATLSMDDLLEIEQFLEKEKSIPYPNHH